MTYSKFKGYHNKKSKPNLMSGFTLLLSIIVTGMLLLVSFIVADLVLKQLLITSAGQQSQIAFYVADSGIECAQYWDLKGGNDSSFATSTVGGSVLCNNNPVITTGSQTIPTYTVNSVIGGAASISGNQGISFFTINFANSSCAIVKVTKNTNNTTTIDSRGYNTCNTSALRRFERGITVTY